MEKLIVDRKEEGILILEREDKTFLEIKEAELPFSVNEGNVIILEKGEYKLSPSDEEERRKRILEKQRKILKKL